MRRARLVYLGLLAVPLVALASCDSNAPTSPTPAPCTYTLSTSTLAFGASGGSESITVTTLSHCTWTAASDRGWIAITSGASGTGTGVVGVSITANPTSDMRTGTVTVAGQAVAVREEGLALEPCTIELSPASASYNKDAAAATFAVSAPGHCAWSATSQAAWLAVSSGGQGTGAGTVSYTVERNRDTTNRSGTISVADRAFTVSQAGDAGACEYSVAPVEFAPCMPGTFELVATVTTQQGCTWTAASDASWISLTGGHAGEGTGVVSFRVSDNWDAPRQGIVMVRWPTITAGQNLRVSQAGCRYALSADALGIGAAGGAGRIDVIQQSEPLTCGGPLQNACVWTAASDVPWITVTTPMPQTGDNPVSFTVAPNDSPSGRTGTIRVRDKVARITQAGR